LARVQPVIVSICLILNDSTSAYLSIYLFRETKIAASCFDILDPVSCSAKAVGVPMGAGNNFKLATIDNNGGDSINLGASWMWHTLVLTLPVCA
jgi:hypothetical protein